MRVDFLELKQKFDEKFDFELYSENLEKLLVSCKFAIKSDVPLKQICAVASIPQLL